jgi:aspartyl-tRNA(Asn)/glutamyl-tRNA(Gln) amidotransferase subunit A
MPHVAFKIGEKIEDPLSLYLVDINTVPINIANIPSLSVPCGFKDGLPIGMQIIGDMFDESTLFNIAYQFEQSTNFNKFAKA